MGRKMNSTNKRLTYEVLYFDQESKRFLNEKFATTNEILEHPMLSFLKNRWEIQYIMKHPDNNKKNIKITKIQKPPKPSEENNLQKIDFDSAK